VNKQRLADLRAWLARDVWDDPEDWIDDLPDLVAHIDELEASRARLRAVLREALGDIMGRWVPLWKVGAIREGKLQPDDLE